MNIKFIPILLPLIAFVIYMTLSSSSGGIVNVSTPASGGCSCHGSNAASTVINLTGLPAAGYQNGVVYSLTLSVSNPSITGPLPRDGFDLTASAGTFTPVAGTLNGLNTSELRHSIPKNAIAGLVTWTFNWTAPASGSSVITFNAACNATNGDGAAGLGDIWNFYATTLVKSTVPVLTVTATSTAISCNGGTSTITATATNGTAPYQYKLNAGAYQTSNTFVGNVAGIYTITVKDALNATATGTRNVTQPTSIVFGAPTITQPLCNGGTGSIVNTATGGTGTKTYTITPLGPQSNTTGTFTGLFPQGFTITATDANACTKTNVVTLGQPTPIVFGTPTITPPLCNGGTGTVSITATGGTGATKTYSINPSGPQTNTSGNFSGLIAQTYTITVSDANNCTKTTAVTMTQPPPLVVTANNVSACTGSSVTLSGSPAGGTFSVANPYTGPSTTYTYTYTNANGCTATSAPASITIAPCGATLNLKLFLEGFYSSASTMVPALMNQGVSLSATETDSIIVELRDQATYGLVASQQVILNTNGTATCTFANANGSYYIAIKHRSGLLTWSALPVSILPGTNSYDFSTAANKAYGDNQKEVETGVFALYCGDLNQDENLDLLDVNSVELDISTFQFGYFPTDINGDGNVDLLDTPALESNVSNFIFSNHP